MTPETKNPISNGSTAVKIGGVLLFVAVLGSLCFPRRTYHAFLSMETHIQLELSTLVNAAKFYQTEYEKWPPTEHLFAVLEGRDVAGHNPQKVIFYDTLNKHTLADGTPLDKWMRPYVFDGIVNDMPRFHSMGQDGIDQHGAQGSDDIVSWK